MRPILAWLLLASCALGQIKLSEQRTQTWVGFEAARVVNGVVIAGPNSKPTLASTSSQIVVEQAIEYKFFEIEAEKIPSLEVVDLEEIEGGYRFKEGTPAGQYRITARAFDPEKGMASKRLTVEVSAAPDVQPIIPDLGDGLSKESRKAIVGLVQNMGADFEALALDVDAGRVKTVIEASTATNTRDTNSRNIFKKQMAAIMEPKLGSAALPADASKTFNAIATGFRSVK